MLVDLAIQIRKRRIKAFPCPPISVPNKKSLEVVEDSAVTVARPRQVLSIEWLIEMVFVGKTLFSMEIKLLCLLPSLCYHKRNKSLVHRKKTVLITKILFWLISLFLFFLFSIKIYVKMMLNLLSVLGCRILLLMISHGY